MPDGPLLRALHALAADATPDAELLRRFLDESGSTLGGGHHWGSSRPAVLSTPTVC
jgi:hypothetical protein